MPNMSIPTTFSINFVGQLEKVNELISKVGARIYYRGGNLNGTWITDEFSSKLNLTLPHIPIVASYDKETDDFIDHEDNGAKKAYGFVPSNPNAHWERGADEKEYLVTDIYLWTGYWPEAAKIINKSQSMEIEPTSIMGDWKVIGGEYYFVYQNAAFKGLCALGNAILPCFEKASFFSLDEESRSFFQSVNEMNEKNLGGGNEKVKDNIEETIVIETPVIYTSEEVAETLTSVEPVVPETVAVDNIQVEQTPAAVEETIPVVEGPTVEEQYQSALQSIESLNGEIARFQTQINDLNNQLTTQKTELDELQEYKTIYLKNEKLNIIEQFKKKLSDEEISEFVNSIDDYTAEELKTKLSVVLADKTLKQEDMVQPQKQFVSIPNNVKESGIVTILRKNKKN
jgi:hypothetical protein